MSRTINRSSLRNSLYALLGCALLGTPSRLPAPPPVPADYGHTVINGLRETVTCFAAPSGGAYGRAFRIGGGQQWDSTGYDAYLVIFFSCYAPVVAGQHRLVRGQRYLILRGRDGLVRIEDVTARR